jgi:hypothetical protein
MLISKKNHKQWLNITIRKIKRHRSRYLISQDIIFRWLYLQNLLVKIMFLFNQTIIKINTHIKLIE